MADHLTQLLEPYAQLFDVKSIEAMGLRVLGAVLVLLVGYWFSRALQRLLVRHVGKHDSGYEGAIDVYRAIIRSVTVVVAGGLALHTLGIDLTHLFTTGGLLAIAAAFAMRHPLRTSWPGLSSGWSVRSSVETCCPCQTAGWLGSR